MTEKHIINIGRQFGSGGRIIGEKLAEKFGFSFYDKELISIASKESGLKKEFFEQVDEKGRFGLFNRLLSHHSGFINDFLNNYLSNETLFKIQSDVIYELAQKQSCVFVGRCADYILRENPHCINIFIMANTPDRIKQIVERQKLSHEKAENLLEKIDKKRAEYYNYYTNKTWGTAKSYHLCINSSLLGIDETVNFISLFVKEKFNLI